MSTVRASACPACAAGPAAENLARAELPQARVLLSVPEVHCAACISTIERDLARMPGGQILAVEPDAETPKRGCRGGR